MNTTSYQIDFFANKFFYLVLFFLIHQKFDDTIEATCRDDHRNDNHRYSENYNKHSRRADNYEDYEDHQERNYQSRHSDSYASHEHRNRHESDNYDSNSPRNHHDSNSYNSHQHRGHREIDNYESYHDRDYHQTARVRDHQYRERFETDRKGYDDLRPQHQHYQDEYDYDSQRRTSGASRQSRDGGLQSASGHANQKLHHDYNDYRKSGDFREEPKRERFDSNAGSHRETVFDHRVATNNQDMPPSQEYMAPENFTNYAERQRSNSTATSGGDLRQSAHIPVAYMSMDGGRQMGGPTNPGRRSISPDCEYLPPSLPKNPPPPTLTSAVSTSPPSQSAMLPTAMKLVDPAPTITLPKGAVEQFRSSNNSIGNSSAVYLDVKGRPKVASQLPHSSSSSSISSNNFAPPSLNLSAMATSKSNSDFRQFAESPQIQLVTSPIVKSPPPPSQQQTPPHQQIQQPANLIGKKPRVPPAPPPKPPKPVIAKQPIKPVVAPIPAVRKSFNAKKKFNPNNMTAAITTTTTITSGGNQLTSNGAIVVPSSRSNNDSVDNNNTNKPRPVPRPRTNANKPMLDDMSDENSNVMLRGMHGQVASMSSKFEQDGLSSPTSPVDDRYQWNLPNSSVPSFI